jgi:peptidoglycan/xylan/chitin deacetylase (PgdA/CDA1 family)
VTTCRNALTVDLEDWYHICGTGRTGDVSTWDAYESRVTRNTAKLLSLLRDHRARATFFVLGYIADREPELIADIAKEGHEIATHGHYHRRVFEMSEEGSRRTSTARWKRYRPPAEPRHRYRAPEWSIRPHTMWALRVLGGEDRYDSAWSLDANGDRSFPTALPIPTEDGEILEFLTTVRCLGTSPSRGYVAPDAVFYVLRGSAG